MEETGLSGVASDMSVDSLKNFIVGMELDWLKEIFSFSTLYQFVAIAAAVGIALFVHRRFGAMLHAMAISFANRGEAWLMRVWVFLLDLGRAVLFSFTAAVLLSLCVILLQTTGLVGEGARLVFVRLSYQIFYAWALLLVILRCVEAIFGANAMGPSLRKALYGVFWTLAALEIVGVLPEIVLVMKSYTLPIGSDKLTIWTLFVGVITVLVTLGLANKVADAAERAILKMSELEMNLRVVFARLCRVTLLVAALLVSLSSVGIDLTILSVFGGALGVGIGFGMQKIASNYISGFIILFDRSIKLGDLVEVAGFSGVITQINTRYSVIRNTAGQELIVPNENFVTGTVMNYSLTERESATTLEVSCAYESNVDRALEIFAECIKAQPRVLKTREPWVVVSELAASGVTLRSGFWVTNPENGTAVLKSNILRDVMRRYAEEGIEIPYNKLDLTVKNAADFRTAAQAAQPSQEKSQTKTEVDHLAQVLAPAVEAVK